MSRHRRRRRRRSLSLLFLSIISHRRVTRVPVDVARARHMIIVYDGRSKSLCLFFFFFVCRRRNYAGNRFRSFARDANVKISPTLAASLRMSPTRLLRFFLFLLSRRTNSGVCLLPIYRSRSRREKLRAQRSQCITVDFADPRVVT